MNVYIDASALVRLYLEETGADAVSAVIEAADYKTASLVGYAETRAALAAARRASRIRQGEYPLILAEFEKLWVDIDGIEVDEQLVTLAGALCDRHPLRGFDSIHLATALTVKVRSREDLMVLATDGRLLAAAAAEGLLVA